MRPLKFPGRVRYIGSVGAEIRPKVGFGPPMPYRNAFTPLVFECSQMDHGDLTAHVAMGKHGQLDLPSIVRAWDTRFQPDRLPFVFKRDGITTGNKY